MPKTSSKPMTPTSKKSTEKAETSSKGRRLTKKQKGFIKDYIETGNGTQAALRNYDVKNENVARSIASENLTKPAIVNSIEEALPNELLAERHLELLNKREVHRIGTGEDAEWEVSDQPDTMAVSKGLDMAYKIKGSYAAEKHINVSLQISKEERDKLLGITNQVLDKMTHEEVNG